MWYITVLTCEKWYSSVHIVRSNRRPTPACMWGTSIRVTICLRYRSTFLKVDIVFTIALTVVPTHNGVEVLHKPHIPAATLHWREVVSTSYIWLEGLQVQPIPVSHHKRFARAHCFSKCIYCCVCHKLSHGQIVTAISQIGHFTSKVADGVMKGNEYTQVCLWCCAHTVHS